LVVASVVDLVPSVLEKALDLVPLVLEKVLDLVLAAPASALEDHSEVLVSAKALELATPALPNSIKLVEVSKSPNVVD